jgi:hypothetical protein
MREAIEKGVGGVWACKASFEARLGPVGESERAAEAGMAGIVERLIGVNACRQVS